MQPRKTISISFTINKNIFQKVNLMKFLSTPRLNILDNHAASGPKLLQPHVGQMFVDVRNRRPNQSSPGDDGQSIFVNSSHAQLPPVSYGGFSRTLKCSGARRRQRKSMEGCKALNPHSYEIMFLMQLVAKWLNGLCQGKTTFLDEESLCKTNVNSNGSASFRSSTPCFHAVWCSSILWFSYSQRFLLDSNKVPRRICLILFWLLEGTIHMFDSRICIRTYPKNSNLSSKRANKVQWSEINMSSTCSYNLRFIFSVYCKKTNFSTHSSGWTFEW